jgi:serine/threonine-protein kinase
LQARIHHRAVCAVHDFGEADGQLYLAMEYLDGLTLQFVARARREIRPAHEEREHAWIAARAFAQIADGLHAIHASDAVHRDVSPHNVFVMRDGSVRIADFGIAFDARAGVAAPSDVLEGKLAYIAPEQLEGAAPDPRADLWSFGVVLWEVLVGRPLFADDDRETTLHAVRSQPVLAPSLARPSVPAELDAPVLALLQRDPDERPSDARQARMLLTEALRARGRFVEDEEIAAWIAPIAAAPQEHAVLTPTRRSIPASRAR